jgi:phospholipase/carboxylesterase
LASGGLMLLPHLERYSLSPDQPVIGTVIWLHGLGASCHDFEPLVPLMGLKHNLRFIFPQAPSRPVTINGDMIMPSWYDILSMGFLRKVSWSEVDSSVQALKDFIQAENERGIGSDRIILAGFSQGGAIVLHTALRLEKPLAGILALSTYLLDLDHVPPAGTSANAQTNLEMQHGRQDPVVPFALAERSAEAIKAAGYSLHWQTYAMEHQVCDLQIRDLANWYQARSAEIAQLVKA